MAQKTNLVSVFYPYPFIIFVIWLITYFICQIAFEQKLGWDEISYLTTARGIAENFDFSGRSNTILGLIKYPFPQSNHHYPVYSTYLAVFFKLFGVSLDVAYFSTWFACLITCLFIYFTLLLLTENKLLSFVFGISFLFLPRIVNYCDTAMMEVPGAALVSVLIFFVFKLLSKDKVNPFIMAAFAMWLYFYKSLFIGILVGFIVLIYALFNKKLTGFKSESKFSFPVCLMSYIGTVFLTYFVFTKFVFLPLAPMMNFNRRTEAPEGTYADFAGGFFNNVFESININLTSFYNTVILNYFPYNIIYYPAADAFYTAIPACFELAIYFLSFFYLIVFSYFIWTKFNPVQRIFIIFTCASIIVYNAIYIVIVGGGVGLISRYNLIYVPLVMISLGILFHVNHNFFNTVFSKHKKRIFFLILSFIFIVYLPFYSSALLVTKWDKNIYYDIAHKSSEVVKKYIGNSNPMFVYFTVGTHTTWDLFPTKVILMEAINKQIKELNIKLPKPIEYLFLTPNNTLFKENQELILKGLPIINNMYTLQGVDIENKIVVYRYNPNHG